MGSLESVHRALEAGSFEGPYDWIPYSNHPDWYHSPGQFHIACTNKKRKCRNLLCFVHSIDTGSVDDVNELINTVDVNHQYHHKYTPLMISSFRDNHAITQSLLRAGGILELQNEYGKTAYDIATEKGHHQIVQLLENEQIIRKRVHLIAQFRHIQLYKLTVPEPYNSLVRLPEHLIRIILLFY